MNVTAIVNASRCPEGTSENLYTSKLTQTGVLQSVLDHLRDLSVDRIQIITGFAREEIEKIVAHRGVNCLYDPRWQAGDRIPWEMGVSGEEDKVLLVDALLPMVLPDTMAALIEDPADVCIPPESAGTIACLTSKAAFHLDDERTILEDPSLCEGLGLTFHQPDIKDEGLGLLLREETDLEGARELEKKRWMECVMAPKIKLMISKGETFFGPGAAAFFTLIDETGSMSAACKAMDMAYSRGWSQVKQVETHMGFPFLERQSGGKGRGCSKLTPRGREFLDAYYRMEEDMKKMSEALFALHFGDKFNN